MGLELERWRVANKSFLEKIQRFDTCFLCRIKIEEGDHVWKSKETGSLLCAACANEIIERNRK